MAEAIPQDPPPSNNRGLWMLVIGLGIAIIVVLALMVGMAIKQSIYGKPADTAAPATAASLKPGEVPELNLDLAPGMTVAETRMDGTHLIVRIVGTDNEEVLVIDPTKSKVLSRIRFNKKAP